VSKFGRQPAADVIIILDLTRPQVANAIGVPITILNNVLAGQQVPSREIREGLMRVLGVPLEELFHPEPLARKIGRRYRDGALVSKALTEEEVKVLQPTKRRRPRGVFVSVFKKEEKTVPRGVPVSVWKTAG
jgi:transcriptional regulator with XRE-family HTH domain